MAQRGLLLDQENFSCSICLDVLKEPVTTYWDEDDQRRTHSCPQCRKTFFPRPVLEKNIMLAELVEELKKTELRSDLCYAGPEDVSCDVCSGMKMKAVKSCLDCLASYCGNISNLTLLLCFTETQAGRPSRNLQQNICSLHDEVMKIYCRTDQQNICYLCLMDEHKGHETVSAATERTDKEKKLQETRQQIQQKIKYREKDMRLFQQENSCNNVCIVRSGL
uniref:B box-type domain-containing protein n=1 Tax=Oryzias latipes TaxID=8090 RepID=A0A3P9LGZ3_ORYLA